MAKILFSKLFKLEVTKKSKSLKRLKNLNVISKVSLFSNTFNYDLKEDWVNSLTLPHSV